MNQDVNMEKKLMLLGLLRAGESHGYRLMEMLDRHIGSSTDLKKPTAYRLLEEMMRDGWLIYRDEKEGRRPTRRVFTITSAGRKQFIKLLSRSLERYQPAVYQHDIGLMFVDALSPEEVVRQLRKRLKIINLHREEYSGLISEHAGSSIVEHQLNHLELDCTYIEKLINHFEEEGVK